MSDKKSVKNLRVVYLLTTSQGTINCRWKDTAIADKDSYKEEADVLIEELSQGTPSGPGTGTDLATMYYHKPTRVLFYLAVGSWSFAEQGHRFNPDKSGCSKTGNPYSETTMLDYDRPNQGVTLINSNSNGGKPVGQVECFGYDLIVTTPDGIVIVIDPVDGNDGDGQGGG